MGSYITASFLLLPSRKNRCFLTSIIDAEPEILSLWSKMVAALQSHINYGPCVKQIVEDINVTDIFIKLEGDKDEDALPFGVN